MNQSPTVIFTGGHHTSALEVARRLSESNWKVIWLGHKYSMWQDRSVSAEYREVTAAGIRFIELKAGKAYRTFHPQKLIRIPYGFIQAYRLLKSIKSTGDNSVLGIVTFGGYLGVPVVFAGWLLGIPVIAHEQTATAGWANRFIALFAQKIALTWPQAGNIYPPAKTVTVGLPLRREILESLKTRAPDPGLIYITGGKQGSHALNQVIFSSLKSILVNHRVVHQTGSSTVYADYATAQKIKLNLPAKLRSRYTIYQYLDSRQAASILSRAGLVISRSGAHIVYELGLFGTRSVLVPIPWSSHDEQQKNAQILADSSQAVILPQVELSTHTLLAAIDRAERLQPQSLPLPRDATEKMVHLIESQFLHPV